MTTSSTTTTTQNNERNNQFRLSDGMLVHLDEDSFRIEMESSSTSSIANTSTDSVASTGSTTDSIPETELETAELLEPPSPLQSSTTTATSSSQSRKSLYGQPRPASELSPLFPPQKGVEADGGLMWKIQIVPTDYNAKYTETNKKLVMLSPKNYDPVAKCIKPRRGCPCVTADDFFSSLVRVPYSSGSAVEGYRWVFSGVLNGWPGLTCLELRTIEYKGTLPRWKTHWEASDQHELSSSSSSSNLLEHLDLSHHSSSSPHRSEHPPTSREPQPTYPTKSYSEVRATLRMPPWSAYGWSPDSLGYVFWYQDSFSSSTNSPRVLYGTNIVKELELAKQAQTQAQTCQTINPKCTAVHMISHRYSRGRQETGKERLTYHSLALLEWDHGRYCSVVEGAWLNGLSGFNGKSNWFEDKDEPVTSLYKALPTEMILPWKETLSEIRVFDVPSQNLTQFLSFMSKHTGKSKRFLDVRHTFSHAVRLFYRSRCHIAQYLLNYIRRGRTYSEIRRNCQTFVADFVGFLAGKKDVQPFHPLNRIEYHNQTHYFLYESSMYTAK